MIDIAQLINDLRCCAGSGGCINCSHDENCAICISKLQKSSADALEQLNSELATLKEKTRWRDASKELPNENGWYITKNKYKQIPNITHFRNGVWADEKCYDIEVTHWRPLPELPKEVCK